MQTLLSRSLMWLFAEVVLTVLNLDDLADYGEFIFRVQDELALPRERIELIALSIQAHPPLEYGDLWA